MTFWQAPQGELSKRTQQMACPSIGRTIQSTLAESPPSAIKNKYDHFLIPVFYNPLRYYSYIQRGMVI